MRRRTDKDPTLAGVTGKTELVIIITPHVMRNISEARRVTDEFRQELAGYRAPRPNRAHMIDQTLRRTLE